MNLIRKSLFPLLLIGATFTQSCKESSTDPGDGGGGTVTNNKPGAGSTYTCYARTTNNGTQKSADSVTYTVSISPTEIKGKSNVYVFSSSNSGDDPRTIAYESNGNISILMPVITTSSQDAAWMTIPVTGSGGTTNLLVSDFDLDLFGTPMHTSVKVSASFVGSENIAIGNKSYTAKKIKTTSTSVITIAGQNSSGTDDDFYWWISELGYYGKSEEGGQVDPVTSQADDLKTETLVHFDLK